MSDGESEYSDAGEDSVGEDAELELSCALQDLALRVKTFEENMRDRFRDGDGGGDDEIDEDIPETDALTPEAVPKRHRRRKDGRRRAASKQQENEEEEEQEENEEEEDEEEDPYGDDAFSEDDGDGAKSSRSDDWDFQERTEELSELKHNIAVLLEGFEEQAKALARGDNQAK